VRGRLFDPDCRLFYYRCGFYRVGLGRRNDRGFLGLVMVVCDWTRRYRRRRGFRRLRRRPKRYGPHNKPHDDQGPAGRGGSDRDESGDFFAAFGTEPEQPGRGKSADSALGVGVSHPITSMKAAGGSVPPRASHAPPAAHRLLAVVIKSGQKHGGVRQIPMRGNSL